MGRMTLAQQALSTVSGLSVPLASLSYDHVAIEPNISHTFLVGKTFGHIFSCPVLNGIE